MDGQRMQDVADAARDGGGVADAAHPPADPALNQLFEELRGLLWSFPAHEVTPEADEADFDNMPV